MDENFRKKIIIFFIIAVIFAISVLVYFFFIKTPVIIPVDPVVISDTLNGKREPYERKKGEDDTAQENYTEVETADEQKLFKIWDKPTAGFSFVNQTIILTSTTTKIIKGTSTEVTIQTKATSSKIYFVDSMKGFVWAYDLKNKKTYQITNTTIPAVQDAHIFNNGENVLMRYADGDTIKSLTAKIPFVTDGNSSLQLGSISYLPNGVSSVASSLFDSSVAFVLPNTNGSSINVNNGKTSSVVHPSLFSDWNISYGGNNIHLTTKPSSYIEGSSFNLNTKGIILREKTGLNVLPSKTDNSIFVSTLTNRGVKDFIMSTKTGDLTSVNFQTLSEKCEWGLKDRFVLCGVPQTIESNDDGLPDAWYKGKIAFTDDLYLKDLKDLRESVFFRFEHETNEKIDVIKPKLNQTENYLGFINKKDKSFWLLKTDYLANIDKLLH